MSQTKPAVKRQIDIIGVPQDLGVDRRGVDMGPSAIRYAHLFDRLQGMGFSPHDTGNIEVPGRDECGITDSNLKHIDAIIPVARHTAEIVARSMDQGHLPLVLGGDHSIAIGSIHGAARGRQIGVIWIDAHADFNTRDTTPTGNIHGMPLATLCGYGDPRLVRFGDETAPAIDPTRVAIIGARDLDPGEKLTLKRSGVKVFGMEQIDRLGMVNILEQSIAIATRGADGIYLSFDVDSLDPRHAPGVGTPVPGGLTYREAHLACEMIADTKRLIGMDFVEVNPILDSKNQTGLLVVELILSALGKRIWDNE